MPGTRETAGKEEEGRPPEDMTRRAVHAGEMAAVTIHAAEPLRVPPGLKDCPMSRSPITGGP